MSDPGAEKELDTLRKLPENKQCANCGVVAQHGHGAVVMTYATFVCHTCKSSHQSFSHLCKSVSMSYWSAKEVKKLRDLSDKKADQVFDLENRKAQLQLSMEERRHEVETHAELLRAQHKMLREDVHRATLEMRERSMKVGVLQTKFAVLVNKVKRSDTLGEGADAENGGEARSQAYYVVKAAQEREDAQRRGDELDPPEMTPLAWKLVAAAGLFAFVNVATTNLAWSLARRYRETSVGEGLFASDRGEPYVETMPSLPTCSRQDTMDGATSRGIAGEGRGAGSCAVGPR